MGELLRYGPHRTRQEDTAWLGMLIFMAAWAMLFAALFFAFAFLRVRAPSWPPAGMPSPPWELPLGNTVVLLCSSITLEFARAKLFSPQRGAARAFLLLTFTLGALFLSLQVLLWVRLLDAGIAPREGGSFAAALYGLTGFHAAHVLIGLCALGWLTVRSLLGTLTPGRSLPLRLWALYWHFVGVAWVVLFLQVFAW